jgi:16S rRNA (guanine966-N2)-methyltransferase
MRIISGNFKGKKISLPNDKFTRPLRDLVKESIFNIIQHSYNNKFSIKGSNILDIFSGTGSFGLECISRGAKKVVFIENYDEAIKILKKNITNLDAGEQCKVIEDNCLEFFKIKKNLSLRFNLIFIDPPFKETKFNDLINLIIENKILEKEGIIIIHRHKNDKIEITNKIKILEERSYGISKLIFGN